MYTLTIETSNKTLSVALFNGTQCVQRHIQYDTLQHSIHLAPAVDKVLAAEKILPNALTQIIVSNGPGSYTGLRIGVTFAKTLAYTMNIPLYAVSSLAILAKAKADDQLIVPFFDARRQHVYAGIYKDGKAVTTDSYTPMETLLEHIKKLKQDTIFISPDIETYQDMIADCFKTATQSIVCRLGYPDASQMLEVIGDSEPVDVHLLTPFYLNKVEAEVNWEKQHQQAPDEHLVEKHVWHKS